MKRKVYYNKYSNNLISRKYGIILMLFSTFLIISLLSYNASDVCINVVGSYPILNFGGKYGAIISDLTLQYFGLTSYFIAFVLFYWSSIIIYAQRLNFYIIKLNALIMVTIIFSILLSFFEQYNFSLQMLPGGYLGYYLYNVLGQIMPHFAILSILTTMLMGFLYLIFFNFTKINVKKVNLKNCYKYLKIFNIFYIFYKINILLAKLLKTLMVNFFKIKLTKATNKKNPVAHKLPAAPDRQNNIDNTKQQPDSKYLPPSSNLLTVIEKSTTENETILKQNVLRLAKTLEEFGIRGDIIGYECGPVVTLYEFKPYPGIKASRVISLTDDIARNMKVISVRIAIISGKDTLGIEIPNKDRAIVSFKNLIECSEYRNSSYSIPLILGCDIFGAPIIADLASMPHLLVAGTTGSGKSVGMNGMILSILYKLSPEKCRFIMIDPKMLEFSIYNDIPHLLMPVITESKNAVLALKWVVKEMESRYKKMSNIGVRNIYGFNEKIESDRTLYGEQESMSFIIVVIDEMADLMVVAGKEIELLVQRLSQMARAAGIHLLMATQRPSVDVITGVIKANFPTRISYQVTSKIDSRTILGEQGAEQLLGKGDMLYMKGGGKTIRVHGPFISDNEVEAVTKYLKSNYATNYIDVNLEDEDEDAGNAFGNINGSINGEASLYNQALQIVLQENKTSISYIQRRLRIGYNKAASLVEELERNGVLSEADITGKRTLLVKN